MILCASLPRRLLRRFFHFKEEKGNFRVGSSSPEQLSHRSRASVLLHALRTFPAREPAFNVCPRPKFPSSPGGEVGSAGDVCRPTDIWVILASALGCRLVQLPEVDILHNKLGRFPAEFVAASVDISRERDVGRVCSCACGDAKAGIFRKLSGNFFLGNF